MSRNPRIHTRPGAMVEIVNRAIQGRRLIRPSPRLNAILIGALAKAQKTHGLEVYGGASAGSHFHLLLGGGTVEDQAHFMRDFTVKLSREAGRLHHWKGTIFPDRYHDTEISQEPEAQLARLRYCLAHGCKEGFVMSPLDWPGVPFAEALLSEEPLQGIWIDRTGYYRALQQGKDVTLEDFTEQLELELTPLPCWAHLDRSARRNRVLEMIRDIEAETVARHKVEGTAPIGATAILTCDPREEPAELKSSPKPHFHAFTQKVRKEMREALFYIVAAYREAADQLRRGVLHVAFPENTFPPARPFVEPAWAMSAPAPEQLEPG